MAKKKANKDGDIRSWIAQQPRKQRPAFHSALAELRKAYLKSETTSIPWWHEVGDHVSAFFPNDDRQYGSNITVLLAHELAGDEPSKVIKRVSDVLWQARIIARNLNKSEVKSWAKKENSKGRPLSAYHVHCLAPVEDKEQRTKLLNKCLEESWSVLRLRAKVQNLFGKKRSRGGRKAKPREVPSPIVALQEIQLEVRHWLANHEVWFADNKAALRKLSKRNQTDELYEELSRAADALIEMQQAVDEGLDCIERIAGEME
jgi:hypothetical protein